MVALLPDTSSPVGNKVLELPAYMLPIRGRYVHRPKSAAVYSSELPGKEKAWLAVHAWCGQHRNIGYRNQQNLNGLLSEAVDLWFTDERPSEDLCGTCDGRYHGALGEDGLIFSPVDGFKPPRYCPVRGVNPTSERCPVCWHSLSAARGWTAYGCAKHEIPASAQVDGWACPSHEWRGLAAYDNGLACHVFRCEYQVGYGRG